MAALLHECQLVLDKVLSFGVGTMSWHILSGLKSSAVQSGPDRRFVVKKRQDVMRSTGSPHLVHRASGSWRAGRFEGVCLG